MERRWRASHSGEEGSPEPHADERPVDLGLERVLAGSLRLAYIPIVVLLLAALGAFVYGTYIFIHSVRQIVRPSDPCGTSDRQVPSGRRPLLDRRHVADLRGGLLRAVRARDPVRRATRIPAWLEMRDLNDLKGRVIAMIVLVLSVSFAEVVVDAAERASRPRARRRHRTGHCRVDRLRALRRSWKRRERHQHMRQPPVAPGQCAMRV